jgi:hypothetical protein
MDRETDINTERDDKNKDRDRDTDDLNRKSYNQNA